MYNKYVTHTGERPTRTKVVNTIYTLSPFILNSQKKLLAVCCANRAATTHIFLKRFSDRLSLFTHLFSLPGCVTTFWEMLTFSQCIFAKRRWKCVSSTNVENENLLIQAEFNELKTYSDCIVFYRYVCICRQAPNRMKTELPLCIVYLCAFLCQRIQSNSRHTAQFWRQRIMSRPSITNGLYAYIRDSRYFDHYDGIPNL